MLKLAQCVRKLVLERLQEFPPCRHRQRRRARGRHTEQRKTQRVGSTSYRTISSSLRIGQVPVISKPDRNSPSSMVSQPVEATGAKTVIVFVLVRLCLFEGVEDCRGIMRILRVSHPLERLPNPSSKKRCALYLSPPNRYGVATSSGAFGTNKVLKRSGKMLLSDFRSQHKRNRTNRRTRCCRSMEGRC